MTAWAASLATGRVQAGEQDILVRPREKDQTGRRGVIFVHGAGQTAEYFMRPALTYQTRFNHALAAAGFTIYAPDLGGTVAPNLATGTWGNDTVVARIESARQALIAEGCRGDKVCLVGVSMGALNALNYTRANPDKVAAVVGIIPVCDINDIRSVGFDAVISAAWEVALGAALPARANPNTTENAALIRSSGADIGLYYSPADTTARPGPVEALASKLGITPVKFAEQLDHSDAQFQFIPTDEIVQRLIRAGA